MWLKPSQHTLPSGNVELKDIKETSDRRRIIHNSQHLP